MASPKFDGVIEAVHYKPDGGVDWLRVYLRRGSTFSDRILMPRQRVIDALKAGKKLVAGKRIISMAGTFDVGDELRLIQRNGQDFLSLGNGSGEKDNLDGVPFI